MRNELKHIIPAAEAAVVRARLSCLLQPDPHAGECGSYFVRSLYFDTPEDKALREKVNGAALREKYRIRLYNHEHSFIRLEKKIKYHSKTAKYSERIDKVEVRAILDGNSEFPYQPERELFTEFQIRMRSDRLIPKNLVDYWREAYYYPAGNVRVTLDSSIRTSVHSLNLFDPGLPTVPALAESQYILEVKYDNFLPEFVQDIIQLNMCTSAPASKYAMCRMLI